MSPSAADILAWSDGWLLVLGPPPVLTAGPDVLFELAGLSKGSVAAASRWSSGEPIAADLPVEQAELRDLLVGLGALRPVISPLNHLRIVGSAGRRLLAALQARGMVVEDSGDQDRAGDLTLVVRTGTSWPAAPPGVHLAVDLTHHHTLVLGPLVVPGVTSCLMCLQRQTTRRWGADQVPAKPEITRWPELTAELIVLQFELARRGESPLVNATIAWDLTGGTTEREDLLRAPNCGGQCRSPVGDSVDLPWLPA